MKLSITKTLCAGPTPRQNPGRHARRLFADEVHAEVRDVVGHVGGAIDRIEILPVDEGRRQPARQHRRSRDDMLPGDDLAVFQPRAETVMPRRPINVVLNVFLTRPDDLHRRIDMLRYAHGGRDLIDLEPTSEPATKHMIVDDHPYRVASR